MMKYLLLITLVITTTTAFAQQDDIRTDFIGEWEGTLYQKPNRKYYFTMMLMPDTASADGLIGVSGIKTTYANENDITTVGDVGMLYLEASIEKGKLNFEEKEVLYQSQDSTNNYYWCLKKGKLAFSTENGMQVLRGKWWADDKNCSPGEIYLVNSKNIQFKTQKAPIYLNATLLEKTLEEMNLSFESRGFNKYKIQLNRYNVSIDIDDGAMILRAVFNADVSLEKLNSYNKTYRWARAYLDRDGDLVIKDELSFKGGIHADNIKFKVEQFAELLGTFTKFIK